MVSSQLSAPSWWWMPAVNGAFDGNTGYSPNIINGDWHVGWYVGMTTVRMGMIADKLHFFLWHIITLWMPHIFWLEDWSFQDVPSFKHHRDCAIQLQTLPDCRNNQDACPKSGMDRQGNLPDSSWPKEVRSACRLTMFDHVWPGLQIFSTTFGYEKHEKPARSPTFVTGSVAGWFIVFEHVMNHSPCHPSKTYFHSNPLVPLVPLSSI